MVGALWARWLRFWFEPSSGTNLAVCRILFFGYLAFYNRRRSGGALASDFLEEVWKPISFFRWHPEALPSPELLTALIGVWKVALVLSCVGWWTRWATATSFFLGLYIVGIGLNFGKVAHPEHVAVLILGILALSRCGEVGSIDAWIARRRRAPGAAAAALVSSEYTWPVRAAWLAMVTMFFAAGVAKLRNAGLDWVFSDSFQNLLVLHHYRRPSLGGWGLTIAQVPWLPPVLAGLSLVAELAAPLALLHPWARGIVVPILFFMQVGIAALMGVHARSPNFVCYAFWVPWDRLGGLLPLRRRRGAGGSPGPSAPP